MQASSVCLLVVGGHARAQSAPLLNPAQAAWLTAASRRIEERGSTTMVSRRVVALEHDLGRPLEGSQRSAIIDAG